MKNGLLILGAEGLVFLLKPSERTKNTNIVKRNPGGLLSPENGNLKNLTDEELKQMALISLKIEKKEDYTQEEAVYYGSLIKKYNL